MSGSNWGRLAMSHVRVFCLSFIVLACGGSAAQEHEHGASEKLGTVHFSTSCSQEAQKEFDRSVALLHSFQFSRAIQGFKETLKEDSKCGIAYWGIALSQWSNPFAAGLKDKSQLEAGRASAELATRTGSPTPRERSYIDAVSNLYRDFENNPQRSRLIAYRDAMADVAAKYPAITKPKSFHALALSAARRPRRQDIRRTTESRSDARKLFQKEPDHPASRTTSFTPMTYLRSPGVLLSRRGAMPKSRLTRRTLCTCLRTPSPAPATGRSRSTTNVAAATAAKREGQTAEELHATDYEIYAYLQTGQDGAAKKIVDSLSEIQSRFDPKAVIGGAGGPSTGYFALSAIPARYALERGDWKQASLLVVHETPFPYTEAMTWFARGLGSARLGQAKSASDAAASLKKIQEQLLKAGENYWALQVEIEQREIEAWSTLAQGDKQEALRQMESAANLEDGTEKSAITPGPLAPARELLGEMLLAANQPDAALAQFEATMKKEPGRLRTLYGAANAAQLAGRTGDTHRYFSELLKICEKGDRPGRPEIQQAAKALAQK